MKDKYDKCVCCNKNTQELKDEHINHRNYYVEGADNTAKNAILNYMVIIVTNFLGPLAQLVRASDS